MKKILSILILSVLICAKNSYAVNIATIGLDASLINTYIAEDESGNTEVKKAIDNFVFNFITLGVWCKDKEKFPNLCTIILLLCKFHFAKYLVK